MGSQGFHNVLGNPFVYQEDTCSISMGIDSMSQTWQLAVSPTGGSSPVDSARIEVYTAANGNISIIPDGIGLFVVGTTSYPKATVKGDVLVASADNTIGVVAGAATAGYVLMANGAGTAPTFQAAAAGGIGTLAGDSGTATGATVTIAGTANQITTSATSATVTISIPSSPSLPGTVTAATGFISTNGSIVINNAAASTAYAELDFRKSRTGAAITSGDGLGELLFKGHDGTGFITASQITSTNSGTVATNRIASDLKFYTHPDSTTASTLRMTIASTGATTIASPDSGVGLTVSGGGITCTSGNIAASSGTLSASTTVTAGTNLVSTAGNLLLPATSSSTIGVISKKDAFGTLRSFIHKFGDHPEPADGYNIFMGLDSGNFTMSTSARYNVGIGDLSLVALTSGERNTGFGYSTLRACTTGSNNSALGGVDALLKLTTGSENFAGGSGALFNLLTGSNNLVIGSGGNTVADAAGVSLTSSESNNILLNHLGVTGASNELHIGTGTGSGRWNLAKSYIAGIYGVTPAGTINIALVDSNGQLGSSATLAQSYLVNGLTWNAPTTTPISAAVNNEYTIKTASGLTTINLPATAAVNARIKIVGYGTSGWTLVAASGDYIHYGSLDTTAGGSLSSTNRYDCVEVVCAVADSEWVVHSSVGTLVVA